jgi:hypothetical protein
MILTQSNFIGLGTMCLIWTHSQTTRHRIKICGWEYCCFSLYRCPEATKDGVGLPDRLYARLYVRRIQEMLPLMCDNGPLCWWALEQHDSLFHIDVHMILNSSISD